jgi:hypothetical protein
MSLTEFEEKEIETELKSKLKVSDMSPLVNEFVNIHMEIENFIKKKEISLVDCQSLYNFINFRCGDATKKTCSEVRKQYHLKTGVFAGDEPCNICPFRDFCSYKYNNPWHTNMMKISDKLMDIFRFKKKSVY